MLSHFLRLAAAKINREIERGSSAGTALGALGGLAVALLISLALVQWDIAGDYGATWSIILGIPFAIAGAMLGSRLSQHSARAGQFDPGGVVRLTNYNRALAPFAVLVLLGGLCAVGVFTFAHRSEREQLPTLDVRAWLAATTYAVSLPAVSWMVLVQIWRVEIDQSTVWIRRTLGTVSYSRSRIREWCFKMDSEIPSQEPFVGKAMLYLNLMFDDGRKVEIPVPGCKSASVMHRLKGDRIE
jgi:hypothetical protein